MARDEDMISLNSEEDQSIQSMEDWDYDDQVLDLDDKALEPLQDEEGSDGEDEDQDWGSRKNAFYDADQDSEAEEEEKEEALLIQKKMLSKIQESDFEDDFHDSFEHIQSNIPKQEKAQVTVDIEKVLSQLVGSIQNLTEDQTFSNQLNWIYATILNYYLYLRRNGSLKYHPISKVISKIQKLVPLMDTLDSFQCSQSESKDDQDIHLDQEEESEMDSDYYNTILKKNKQKKQDRENAILQAKNEKRAANYALQDSDLIDDDAKRMASWKILTNKGLTPHRKKENRNPRVKKRKKYEKAIKKLSSFRAVAVDKSSSGPYGGERTGIRRNLTRSIKF